MIRYILLIIGLTGYTISGINWNIGIAAWIAPIFLLYYTRNSNWRGFLLLILGLAFSAALSKTAENLSGLFIIYITTGLTHGIINSLPYLIDKLLAKQENKFYCTLIFPSAIVLVEYLLSLGIGMWGNASIAQYYNQNLIQITSVFGIFGISFLVAWLASTINWIVKNGFESHYIKKGLGVYGVVFTIVLLYGDIRTSVFPPESETVKVATIVSDTDIHEVFSEREEEIIELSKNYDLDIPDNVFSSTAAIESQIEKTHEALNNGAKIVVWNEISLILKQSQLDSLLLQIKNLCRNNSAFVLTAFLEQNSSALPKPFNNKSVLLTPNGDLAWVYLKAYPHPLENLIMNKGDASIPFIDTDYGRIGNAICSDLDIPGYMSQIGKNKIDILLVPAFDWVEITPYHSNMAAFTAIQFGVSIIRSNGKGIVAFYDYQGKTLAKMNTFLSNSKIVYAEIPIRSTRTVYSTLGDIIAYMSILFLIFISGLRITRKSA